MSEAKKKTHVRCLAFKMPLYFFPLPLLAPQFFEADQSATCPEFMFLAAADCARAAKEPLGMDPDFWYSFDITRRSAGPSK